MILKVTLFLRGGYIFFCNSVSVLNFFILPATAIFTRLLGLNRFVPCALLADALNQNSGVAAQFVMNEGGCQKSVGNV